jgi:hypothetical protein
MKLYPNFSEDQINDLLKFIVRERNRTDVQEFANLPQVFISGRKVGKIPANAADVSVTDRVGDFNYDDQYIYILTTVTGTATWGRSPLDTAW